MTSKRVDSVYGRALRAAILCLLVFSAAWPTVHAQGDDVIVDARDALRKKDGKRLAVLRATAVAANHPLAMWVDYWELTNRIVDVQQPEVDKFSAAQPCTASSAFLDQAIVVTGPGTVTF